VYGICHTICGVCAWAKLAKMPKLNKTKIAKVPIRLFIDFSVNKIYMILLYMILIPNVQLF